jgi:endonuclease III
MLLSNFFSINLILIYLFRSLPENLIKSIKICGLSKIKANYILNALNYLQEHNWLNINLDFINTLSNEEALKALIKIKGVGIKSASCLLMFAFKRGTFPIDTHLFRILKRVGNIMPVETNLVKAHKLLQPQVQGELAYQVHVALIELGRKICIAGKNPKCSICYLNLICEKKIN